MQEVQSDTGGSSTPRAAQKHKQDVCLLDVGPAPWAAAQKTHDVKH